MQHYNKITQEDEMIDLEQAVCRVNTEITMLLASPSEDWENNNEKFKAMAALLVRCLSGLSFYDAKAIGQQFQFEVNKASTIRDMG